MHRLLIQTFILIIFVFSNVVFSFPRKTLHLVTLQKKIDSLEKEIKRLEQFGGMRGSYSPQVTCEGRLTTQSGTAISTSDQSSKSTIYFTTYHGSVIGL